MKKVVFTFLAFIAIAVGATAQVAHDFNPSDREPGVLAKLTVDQVPPSVVNAVKTQFDKNKPETWSKFPYALKEYGWVYDLGAAEVNLDRYEVIMKTDKNTDLWAVYTNKGELVETREVSKDIAMPADILTQFQNSQYKDWKIVGNKEVIRFYHDHSLDKTKIEQHFRINVEKDGVKRAVSFNYKGTN
jgi:hypothetical protein